MPAGRHSQPHRCRYQRPGALPSLRVSDLPHSDKIKYLNAEDATVAHVVSIREEAAPAADRGRRCRRSRHGRAGSGQEGQDRRGAGCGGQEGRCRRGQEAGSEEVTLGGCRAIPGTLGRPHARPRTGPFLVVGLGNPGLEYLWTPHNAGFMAIDRIARQQDVVVQNRRCRAVTATCRMAGREVMLAKPETFMNLSGLRWPLWWRNLKWTRRRTCSLSTTSWT